MPLTSSPPGLSPVSSSSPGLTRRSMELRRTRVGSNALGHSAWTTGSSPVVTSRGSSPATMSLSVLAMRLRTRVLPTSRKSEVEKPSARSVAKNSSPKRREAERREARAGSASQRMRRASLLLSSLRKNRGRADLMERARSPFGAPPRHPRLFRPRLGSGRASWNHRMQTGGPSPAPVQRAPRSPTRAGRDDAQAARERNVSLRPREPLPLRPKEYPRDKASFASGILTR